MGECRFGSKCRYKHQPGKEGSGLQRAHRVVVEEATCQWFIIAD